MLKKRVLKRLLPLLFSFCCVFSGFLSVKSFAYTSYSHIPLSTSNVLFNGFNNGTQTFINLASPSSDNIYKVNNPSASVNNIWVSMQTSNNVDEGFIVPVDVDVFDYYLVASFYGSAVSSSSFSFFPDSFAVRYLNVSNGQQVSNLYKLSDLRYYQTNTDVLKGFSVSCKIDFSDSNIISSMFIGGKSGTIPADVWFECSVISVPKDTSSDAVNGIITAINNQTGALQGSIDQAADDVQQSIEDQYSGDPETEFSVEDVITQHNEKMGVLSFGSDVMLQFLDMFQSANVGTAELTLPGFNITVENVEYSVWPDYSFNFEQLNEWVPALMSVIRVMLPAFVWLMVLRYCIKVFEDNFLAK